MCPSPTPRDRASKVRPWTRVIAVASDQWGTIDHRQLAGCDVPKMTVSRWTAEGRLHRLHRGVYAVGHPAVPYEGQLTAALFFAGSGATLSHATAAWWWGLVADRPNVIQISLNGRRRRPVAGIHFHNRRELDRTWHRRLPVTSVPQTLLDLAATSSFDRIRSLLAEAEFGNLVDLRDVAAVLRRGRPGSGRLRAALDHHMPQLARTRSELERRFLLLCESARLRLPEVNVRFRGYTIDALWRQQRVAVELDGLRGHRTPAQLERDHQRDLMLRAARYAVRRYTWNQVNFHGDLVEADVRAALERGD
jgi:very-short-patch-repair endonuclease